MSIIKMEVLIVTFRRDLDWTRVCLQSFRKYCRGFSGVKIVVPINDLDAFLPFEKEFSTPDCPVFVKNFLEMPNKGFLHHLVMKCYADVICAGATHILHTDPDTLFSSPQTPLDYIVEGRPVLLVEPYEAVARYHEGRANWKKVTEVALRFDCPYETMCRHPAVHYNWLYKATRDHIEAVHGTPFTDFVLKQQNQFPQGFGEFNTLGSMVMHSYRDKYHIVDRGFDKEKNDPSPKLTQLWSYTGINASDNQAMIQKILS